jgi:hypothetical protein
MSQQLDDLQTNVSDLVDEITDATQNGAYSEDLNDLLDDALVLLQKVQNAVTQDTEEAIIAGLSAQNAALSALNLKIDAYTKTLDSTAAKIKTIANDFAIVASVVAGIATSGVL